MALLLYWTKLYAAEHKYIGVAKCKMCHSSDTKGNQYKHWYESRHAKAYETLGIDAAKETAQKAGVTGNPQEEPKCLKCHVTAYGVDNSLLGEGFKKEEGVQCESCHGAGGDYMAMSVMKDKQKAIENGLVMPTKEVCITCHNPESPNYKEFSFGEFYPKVAHPRPKN
ncbi:MAG: cytochrome c family protein [Candidatus Omnitrophota bacterium]